MTSSSSHKSSGQSSQDQLSEFFSSSLSLLILIGEVITISQADFLWTGWRIIVEKTQPQLYDYMRVGTLKLFCISN